MGRRNDGKTGRALEKRAGAHSRGAEANHRAILTVARARPNSGAFAKVLASMPNVGLDSDFERVDSTERSAHIFE
jgi:plasmid stability protein